MRIHIGIFKQAVLGEPIISLGFLTGCNDDDKAQLRVIHASPDAPTVFAYKICCI